MIKDIREFRNWLETMLEDANKRLEIDDATLAYALLNRGIRYLRATHDLKLDDDFVCWLEETIRDAKRKLNVDNETLADVLLSRGVHYYLRTIGKKYAPPTKYPNEIH